MWIFSHFPQENHSKYFSSLQSPHTPPLFHSEQISPLLSFEEHNHCSEFLLSTQVSAPCRATLVSLLRADPQCLTERCFRLSPRSPSWWASSFLSTALNTILWRNIFLLLNPEVLLFPTIFLLSLLSWLDFCKSYIYCLHFLSVFSILALKSSLPIY